MSRWRLVAAGVWLWVSTAQAGLVVDLVPDHTRDLLWGAHVTVDVFIRQDVPAKDQLIRFLQFDFNLYPKPEIIMPIMGDPPITPFWDCGPACDVLYEVDGDLDGDPAGVISIDWRLDIPSPEYQVTLPGDGSPLRIGAFEVVLDFGDVYHGPWWIDLLDAEDPIFGAELRFGFGDDDPLTTWRADTGDITGGQLLLYTVPEPSALVLLGFSAAALVRRRR